jgi:hypothetical protein
MLHVAEPLTRQTRWLYYIGKLALLALVLVPLYLVVNEWWQSLFRLVVLYGLLALFCLRLGEAIHRTLRRLPAEIPLWSGLPPSPSVPPLTGAAVRRRRGDPECPPRSSVCASRPQAALATPDSLPFARDP